MKKTKIFYSAALQVFTIITFSILLDPCKGYSQSQKSKIKTQNLLLEFCPFEGSTTKWDNLLTKFYIANKLIQYDQMDSLYKIVNQNKSLNKTPFDSAFFYFDQAFYWMRKSDFPKSRELYNKSGLILKRIKRGVPEQYVKVHMANIDYYLKRVKEARDKYIEVSKNDSSDTFLKASLFHNIGVLQMELDSISHIDFSLPKHHLAVNKITEYLDKSISLNKSINYTPGLSLTYSTYNHLLTMQGKYNESRKMIQEAEKLARDDDDVTRIAFLQIKKCLLLRKEGNFKAAIDTGKKAMTFYDEIGNYDQYFHAAGMVFYAYKEGGFHEKAADFGYNLLHEYRAQFNEKLSEDIGKFKEQYESEKKELIIKEQESAIEQERLTVSNKNRLLGILGFGTISIALLMFTLLQRNKRKAEREKNALLIKSKEEGLKNIINAQEDERKRIAKDLHDGIVQQLGGLKLGFQKILSEDPNPESKKLLNILDDSAQELRELSHKMMPKSLSELGLIPAINDMLDNSLGHTNITYNFENFGLKDRLKENVEITIYRIAQELINNITKHSQASQVNVQLFKSGGLIIFIVEDNGKGFDLNTMKKGIGLLNISSRLDTINGKVNYDPSPESGTLVTVKIPL